MKSLIELEGVGDINWKDFETHKVQLANVVGIEAAKLKKSDSSLRLFEMWTEGRAKLRPNRVNFGTGPAVNESR